ncbi:MAG: NADH-quinone oxidoreductase subunit J [Mycobacteriales bacterium]
MSAGTAARAVTALGAITHTSTGESVAFWILAPVAVLCALWMVVSRNAVHAALLLVVDFFCLAVFYALQQAPFLAAVEVIVYAGAIMVLFLFVLMLVGVDSGDSLVETLPGQRGAAVALGVGLASLLCGAIGNAVEHTSAIGLSQANAGGNVQAIARLLFTTYVFPFEATSALLIVAAVGAMVLGHQERTEPRRTQREMSRARFAGTHPSPYPGPGVFAGHDAVDGAGLLPDGSLADASLMPEYFAGERPLTPRGAVAGPDPQGGSAP